MPSGHADLLDGIYGDWGEGLRGLGVVLLVRNPGRLDSGFIDRWGRVETGSQGNELLGPGANFQVGNRTPALLTSSS
jgi:hypothetical protein